MFLQWMKLLLISHVYVVSQWLSFQIQVVVHTRFLLDSTGSCRNPLYSNLIITEQQTHTEWQYSMQSSSMFRWQTPKADNLTKTPVMFANKLPHQLKKITKHLGFGLTSFCHSAKRLFIYTKRRPANVSFFGANRGRSVGFGSVLLAGRLNSLLQIFP